MTLMGTTPEEALGTTIEGETRMPTVIWNASRVHSTESHDQFEGEHKDEEECK